MFLNNELNCNMVTKLCRNCFSLSVPVARIQAPLQDALVPEGQDALFSIELSASVIGTWFLNGIQLQEDERFSMRRSRTHQSLRIRGVRDTDNGAEITFIAYSIRDSAALYIQGMHVSQSEFAYVPFFLGWGWLALWYGQTCSHANKKR